MIKRMEGKTAVVTGGASGIGKVTAQIFAREGAKVVVVTDSNIKGAEETVQLIKKSGGEASFVKCDVSKAEDVEAMVNRTVELYGSLDYAFNNAGIGPDGKRVPLASIIDHPVDLWNRTIGINLTGVFLCMKYEMKQMQKQKSGAIVNTSSVGAFKPLPGFAAYDASKTGLIGLSKVAALEGAQFGVRVNVICPGPTERTLLLEYLTGSDPDIRGRMTSEIPLSRLAEPEEMAEAVIWLCSQQASYITGHVMPIDGGLTTK